MHKTIIINCINGHTMYKDIVINNNDIKGRIEMHSSIGANLCY